MRRSGEHAAIADREPPFVKPTTNIGEATPRVVVYHLGGAEYAKHLETPFVLPAKVVATARSVITTSVIGNVCEPDESAGS